MLSAPTSLTPPSMRPHLHPALYTGQIHPSFGFKCFSVLDLSLLAQMSQARGPERGVGTFSVSQAPIQQTVSVKSGQVFERKTITYLTQEWRRFGAGYWWMGRGGVASSVELCIGGWGEGASHLQWSCVLVDGETGCGIFSGAVYWWMGRGGVTSSVELCIGGWGDRVWHLQWSCVLVDGERGRHIFSGAVYWWMGRQGVASSVELCIGGWGEGLWRWSFSESDW